jgi:hypothetical protein
LLGIGRAVVAAALGLAELVERPEKTVRQAGLVAGELRQGLAAVAADRRADQEGLGLRATVGQTVGEQVVVAAGLVEFVGEGGRFEARDATHAPLGVGELAQQGVLESVGGLEQVL